jgi:hypothetical protein
MEPGYAAGRIENVAHKGQTRLITLMQKTILSFIPLREKKFWLLWIVKSSRAI